MKSTRCQYLLVFKTSFSSSPHYMSINIFTCTAHERKVPLAQITSPWPICASLTLALSSHTLTCGCISAICPLDSGPAERCLSLKYRPQKGTKGISSYINRPIFGQDIPQAARHSSLQWATLSIKTKGIHKR